MSDTFNNFTATTLQGFSVSTQAPTNGQALVWNSTSQAWEPASATPPGLFGDGADGAVVYAANTTLTSNVRASTVVVNSGVVVDLANFMITATVSIVNHGTLHCNGKDASGATPGSLSCATFNPCHVVGGDGGTPLSNGNASLAPVAGAYRYDLLGGDGGAGGGGGTGGSNSIYTIAALDHPFSATDPTRLVSQFGDDGTLVVLPCGCGGGGGDSGAGGGGAGIVRLRAPLIDTSDGIISANGGAGGAAPDPDGSGGGGGGGGRVILVGTVIGLDNVTADGGIGGAGDGAGVAGSNGQDGTVTVFS